jgi:D-aminopeptidase
VMGAPVGRELGQWAFKGDVERERGDGSIMMVVATDAPLSDRNLERLAARAIMGLSRTGSAASNGSGDYVIAFSTSPLVRRRFGPGGAALTDSTRTRPTAELTNDDMSALFQGVVEATEEAIYNSLTTATTVTAREGTAEAIPIGRLVEVLRKYGIGR